MPDDDIHIHGAVYPDPLGRAVVAALIGAAAGAEIFHALQGLLFPAMLFLVPTFFIAFALPAYALLGPEERAHDPGGLRAER